MSENRNNKYLTEERLSGILGIFYKDVEIIRDKCFPGHRFRPDFYIPELKLVIEFDGHLHYTEARYVLSDKNKEKTLVDAGITLVRVPYFIQLNTRVISYLLNIDYAFTQVYPHGFIDKKVVLPADYCEIGIERFINDLEKFSFIKSEIILSIKSKITSLQNQNLVIPQSLAYLVN